MRHAIASRNEQLLADAIQSAGDSGITSSQVPEVSAAKDLLDLIWAEYRIEAAAVQLLAQDIGRIYPKAQYLLKQAAAISFTSGVVRQLSRQSGALYIQRKFRGHAVRQRVSQLRAATRKLQASIDDQDPDSIAEAASALVDLEGFESAPVKEARYIITWLRKRANVLRDVMRADKMLDTGNATAYAMNVLEKALRNAKDFDMLGYPRVQKAAKRLLNLERGRRGRDTVSALLATHGKTSVPLERQREQLQKALADVLASEFRVNEQLKQKGAEALHVLEQQIVASERLTAAVESNDLSRILRALESAQHLQERFGKARTSTLSDRIHEAQTMMKYLSMSQEFVKITPSSHQASGHSRAGKHVGIEKPAIANFMRWCDALENAETDEIRRFWFHKLSELVGGHEKLRSLLQNSQWKRLSRRQAPFHAGHQYNMQHPEATSNTGYVRGPAMSRRLGRSQAVHTHRQARVGTRAPSLQPAYGMLQQAKLEQLREAYRQSKLRETEHRRLRGAVMAEEAASEATNRH